MSVASNGRGPRILVVDDEPDVKLIVQQKFRKHMREQDWHFEFAHNGQDALTILQARHDIELVLTDINMPIMDGLALLRELNGLDREVRAVVISAYGDLGNIRSAMNLGAFDFVTKPIDMSDLESTIHKTLTLVQRLKEARRLEREALEAEVARQARSRFLEDLSYELRTPLNAIVLYSELIVEEAGEVGAQFLPDLQKIKAAGKHLLTLINDVVDFSRIEAGSVEFHREQFSVTDAVAEVVDILQEDLRRNDNKLDIQVAEACGDMYADATRVRQILFNVVGNAAKFTQRGTITLEVAPQEGGMIRFRVADTGCGMSPEQVERIFQPYTQLTLSTGTRYGTAGLGLTSTRHLCTLMGGRIEVESEPGKGSVFTVELPVGSPQSLLAP